MDEVADWTAVVLITKVEEEGPDRFILTARSCSVLPNFALCLPTGPVNSVTGLFYQ